MKRGLDALLYIIAGALIVVAGASLVLALWELYGG